MGGASECDLILTLKERPFHLKKLRPNPARQTVDPGGEVPWVHRSVQMFSADSKLLPSLPGWASRTPFGSCPSPSMSTRANTKTETNRIRPSVFGTAVCQPAGTPCGVLARRLAAASTLRMERTSCCSSLLVSVSADVPEGPVSPPQIATHCSRFCPPVSSALPPGITGLSFPQEGGASRLQEEEMQNNRPS